MAAPRALRTTTLATPSRTAFRPSPLRHSLLQQTRRQTTVAEPGAGQSKFQELWNSKVGPKTVHFWAPVMKWGVVLAGVSDFFRPPEALSLSQNMALVATGMIWTRWCFIIKPRNLFLAAVNFFLFTVGATQTARILNYRKSLKSDTVGDEVKDAAEDARNQVEGMAEDPKGAVKKAENV